MAPMLPGGRNRLDRISHSLAALLAALPAAGRSSSDDLTLGGGDPRGRPLIDCLRDWHGHDTGGQALTVLVDDAGALIRTGHLGVFLSVLCQAAWHANLRLDADGVPYENWPPFPLHFVLLVSGTDDLTAFAEAAAADDEDIAASIADDRLTLSLTGPDWPVK
ncbi:hypothetical protein [Actinoplanes sp. NPDC023714]|uniref:hypothetical protein n=1 Tax=Actinoplanes sp. NPDC023714 TaxID=3154322 RepID=UPI003411BA53